MRCLNRHRLGWFRTAGLPVPWGGVFSLLVVLFSAGTVPAGETLARRLVSSYAAVQRVSVDARKDISTGDQRIRMLSRVWFERPDRLRVDNSEPVARRLLSDGRHFYMTIAEHDRGLRQPVSALSAAQRVALQTVPGTAMENLLRLLDLAETDVPSTDRWPVRRGYAADRHYVVLSVDTVGRLERIDFFEGPAMGEARGEIVFEDFTEPLPGVWIPLRHVSRIREGDVELLEIRRFSNLSVNEPIAAERFDPQTLDGITDWVADMETLMAP